MGLDNQFRTIINVMSTHNPGSNPLYSFLLLGSRSPGHGKTALAEVLAEKMFDNRNVENNKYESKKACE